MRKILGLFVVTALLGFSQGPAAYAARKDKEVKPLKKVTVPKRPVKIRMKLTPLVGVPADLATAQGSIDGMVGRNKTELRVKVQVPFPAPSLAIADLATAKASQLRMEITRGDAITNDCQLAALVGEEELVAGQLLTFRLHAKDRGKRFVKGQCANGLPILLPTDKVLVYGVVNATRLDFLGVNQVANQPTP